jgi:putative sporulation protein YyaC
MVLSPPLNISLGVRLFLFEGKSHMENHEFKVNLFRRIDYDLLRGKDIVFLCVGTDRSTGDALGPLVGTYLEEEGYHVVGTLKYPLHAMNLQKRIAEEVREGQTIIAIDATLGARSDIGNVTFRSGGLKPGAGVNRDLGAYGDYSITGCVNVGGFMEFMVLQNTPLYRTMMMVDCITREITTNVPPVKRLNYRDLLKKAAINWGTQQV